jgi:hypothetical protein
MKHFFYYRNIYKTTVRALLTHSPCFAFLSILKGQETRGGQVKPEQTRPDRTEPAQTRPYQSRPDLNEITPEQIRSDLT